MADENLDLKDGKVNSTCEDMVELETKVDNTKVADGEIISDSEDENTSARVRRHKKMREAEDKRERTRFKRQLTLDEIRVDLEHMNGVKMEIKKREKKTLTQRQKLKSEMSFPGSQLEELYKRQVLNEKPSKKKVGRWGWK